MPPPSERTGAEILCVGSELLLGSIVNSNARDNTVRAVCISVTFIMATEKPCENNFEFTRSVRAQIVRFNFLDDR